MSLEMNSSTLAGQMSNNIQTVNLPCSDINYIYDSDKHLEVEIMLCAFRNHYDQKMKWIEEAVDWDDSKRTQEKMKILETYAQQLSEQNELLISTLADLQREANHRVTQMENRLKSSAVSTMEVVVHLHEYEQELRRMVADKLYMEAALESTQHQLSAMRFENSFLRDQNNNLHHDIQGLLHIIQHARSTGHWEMDCVTFCELTPEQVFGPIHSMSHSESQESLYPHPSTSVDTEEMWRQHIQSTPSCISSHSSSISTVCSHDKTPSRLNSAVDRMQQEFHHLYHLQEEAHNELLEKDRLIASLEFQLAEVKHKLTLKEAESSCHIMEIKSLKEQAKCLLMQDSGLCSWKKSAEVHFLTTPMILKSQSLPSVCYPKQCPSVKEESLLPSMKHCYEAKTIHQSEVLHLSSKGSRRQRKMVQNSTPPYPVKVMNGISRRVASDPLPHSHSYVTALYRCSSFTDTKTIAFLDPWFSDDRCKVMEPCHSMDVKEFIQLPDSFEVNSGGLLLNQNGRPQENKDYSDDFQEDSLQNYSSFKGRSSTVQRTHIDNGLDTDLHILNPVDSLEVLENHLSLFGKKNCKGLYILPTASPKCSSSEDKYAPLLLNSTACDQCSCSSSAVFNNSEYLTNTKICKCRKKVTLKQDSVGELQSHSLSLSSCDNVFSTRSQSTQSESVTLYLSVSTQTEIQKETVASLKSTIPIVNGMINTEDFERNMRHLQEQIRRAEDKAAAKEILIQQLQGHLQTTVREVELKDKALENAERKLESARQECASLKDQISLLEEQVEQLYMELDHARVLHDNLTLNVEARKEQIEEMHQHESMLQDQKRLLMTQLDSQGDELLQTREELKTVQAQLHNCNIQLEQQVVIIQNLQEALVQSKRALDETKKSPTANSEHASSNASQLHTKNVFHLRNSIVDV